MSLFRQAQYSIPVFVGLGLLILGGQLEDLAVLPILGGILMLAISSHMLAQRMPGPHAWTRFILGLSVSLSLLMIGGSAIYYLGTVTLLNLTLLIALLPFASWLLSTPWKDPVEREGPPTEHHRLSTGVLLSFFVIALVVIFQQLGSTQALEATRSPWLILPPSTLLWIVLAGACALLLAFRKAIRLTLITTSGVLFAGIGIAAFVFPLGYGFDPFLHQATIDHIAQYGTITPKPFYYIGQYALELLPVVLGGIQTHTIDIALLPILAALFLPVAAATSVWLITRRAQPTALAAMATLLLPLSNFINTTPQGMANLWSLLVFFLFLPELATGERHIPQWALGLLAIGALLTHPLAGLPAVLFFLFGWVATRGSWPSTIRTTLLAIGSVLGAIMLPVAFFLSGTGHDLHLRFHTLSSLIPPTFFSTRYDVIGDLVALIGVNSWIWLIALAVLGAYLMRGMLSKYWMLLPLLSLVLLANAVILSVAGDFSFLIDYEQTNYVDRVIQLTLFALLPLSVLGVALGTEKLLQMKKTTVTAGLTLLFMAAIGANIYTAYPRHDAYAVSRGFTVGQSDYHTVASIASNADQPYVVLANQAVSAAAISQDGFAHYYGDHGDVFYYPVPTGGPLYQIFLEMIEEVPTHDLALDAMNLTGVNRVYFVVNHYWWSAEAAIERAKVSTENWFEIDDGATTVFIYDRFEDVSTATN